MLRICSTLARDTSESSSFLKVDPRKKQITLYDPLTCGGQNVFQKRGNQVPPKMFAFDAVFPQDASQVGVTPSAHPRLRQCGSFPHPPGPVSWEGIFQSILTHQFFRPYNSWKPIIASLDSSVPLNDQCQTLGRITVPGFQQNTRGEKEGEGRGSQSADGLQKQGVEAEVEILGETLSRWWCLWSPKNAMPVWAPGCAKELGLNQAQF